MTTLTEPTAFVPLPFRVLGLVGLGLLCWASNLHILHLLGIDATLVLDTQRADRLLPVSNPASRPDSPTARSHSPHPLPPTTASLGVGASKALPHTPYQQPTVTLHPPVYRIFAWYSLWLVFNYAFFIHFVGGDRQRMDKYKYIPALATFGAVAALFSPFNVLQRRERAMFLHSIKRCLSISNDQHVFFCDVVLADIFTSFAKVLGDVWISLNMFMPAGSLLMGVVDIEGWNEWLIPVLMSLPYAVRLRQCLVEYNTSKGSNTRALLNAIKYATSFPVIFLSAAQKLVISDIIASKGIVEAQSSTWHGEHQIFRLWFLSVCVSSVYSFWWDVTNDWGLNLLRSSTTLSTRASHPTARRRTVSSHQPPDFLTPSSQPTHTHSQSPDCHPYGLRSSLVFSHPLIYYLAIFLNFILRFAWSMKLSTHLHTFAELETGVLVMEALELLRRWLWVFFRVEWEACKMGVVATGGADEMVMEAKIRLVDE